jgi:glycosyltransferase 2 family protein
VVLLVPALVGLALMTAAYPPGGFERSLISFLASFPGWLDPGWGFLYDLLSAWAVVLVVAAVIARRRVVALQGIGSLLLAIGIALVSARLALGHWPDVADAVSGGSHSPAFPALRVAEAAAVIVTIGPHLVRRLQAVGRWILVLGFVGALLAGSAVPSGDLAAVLIALVAAAGVRLAFGTSAGRPGLSEVAAALAELGVSAERLEMADEQVAGVVLVHGLDPEGQRLLVKVHGRDAYDDQLLSKLWRALWYQGAGPGLRLSRSQVAEHEAFVTLLARNARVATREVVTAGTTVDDDALLVLRGAVRPLHDLSAAEVDDELLLRAWRVLALLADSNIAHLRIDPFTVALVGGELGLIDFGAAKIAPRADQLMTDRAQLLVTTAAVAGSERALAAALESLGADGMTSLLPYLQSAALGGRLREVLKNSEVDVEGFRKKAAQAVGAEPPELVKLRRVTWATVLQLALLALAATAILSVAVNVDWATLRSDLADAAWGWVAFGFVVAQLPRLTQAVATLGSVAVRLPFGPVYLMQLATSYMNLAMPSSLARLAVNIRFFQCQGLPGAAAVTSGAIDGFAGNVVQVLLLVLLLLFSGSSLSLELSAPSGGPRNLLWILVAVVIVSILVVLVVPRFRRAIVGRVRTWWPQVRAALGALRASHKLAQLLAGSVATEVLFAVALGLFAEAFGYDISLTTLLVINMSVSLLGSFVPVPGGIGVVEYGLTIGLTSAGMPQEAALATVFLYRLSTFYLPPIWGFFALRWLQRNHFL